MSEATTTVAFRVPLATKDEIVRIADADRLKHTAWIRDVVLKAVHASSLKDGESLEANAEPPLTLREVVELIKTAIAEERASHEKDLQVIANAIFALNDNLDKLANDMQQCLSQESQRLLDSQRSHKQAILDAMSRTAKRPY